MRGTRIAIVGFSIAALSAGAAVTAPVLLAKKEGGGGGRSEEGDGRRAGFQRPSMRGALKPGRRGSEEVMDVKSHPTQR